MKQILDISGTFKVPAGQCPVCQEPLDACGGPGDSDGPSPGDISFCMKCGAGNIFDDNLQFRTPTAQEEIEIAADPTAQILRKAIASVVKDKLNS